MSELQFPNRHEFEGSEEAYQAALKDVAYNWLVRDLVTNCILESLGMFFRLTEADVDDIMGVVKFDDATIKEVMTEGREEFIRRLRAQVQPRLKDLVYKKLVLG